MAHDKLLAEWFWTDRWMGSSAFLLPLAARGLYREMLTQAWRRGAKLPADFEAIQRAVGCTSEEWLTNWPLIEKYWHCDRGALFNQTQRKIFAQTLQKCRVRTAAGRRGGLKTQALKRQAKPQANGQAKINSPSPSPSLYVQEQIQERVDEVVNAAKATKAKLERTVSVLAETVEEALRLRAGALLQRYAELFTKHCHGARYHNRMHLDFDKALSLVRTWPDDGRLEKLAVLILTTDDDWIAGTDRGFGVFAAKASWADKTLAAWEAEHGLANT